MNPHDVMDDETDEVIEAEARRTEELARLATEEAVAAEQAAERARQRVADAVSARTRAEEELAAARALRDERRRAREERARARQAAEKAQAAQAAARPAEPQHYFSPGGKKSTKRYVYAGTNQRCIVGDIVQYVAGFGDDQLYRVTKGNGGPNDDDPCITMERLSDGHIVNPQISSVLFVRRA